MLALLVSLTSLTSCSRSDNPVAVQRSSTQLEDESAISDKSNQHIDAWYDAGVLHNQIVRACDDSLKVNYPNKYTTYGAYKTWMFDGALRSYIVQNTSINSTVEASARAAFWVNDSSDIHLSDSELTSALSTLVSNGDISSRESSYIQRYRNIISLCYGSTTMSVIADSMLDWKSDILAISWNSNETTIGIVMSVAYYSFDFWLNEGMDDTDPNYDGPSLLRNDNPGGNAAQIDEEAVFYAIHTLGKDPITDHDWIVNFAANMSASWGLWYQLDEYF